MKNINIYKLAFITAALFLWNYSNHNCVLFAFALISITFFLAISFAESKILYRSNIATAIFKEDSVFFSWLNTRWYVLLTSIFKALLLATIVLINSLQWNDIIVVIMLIDVLFLLAIYQSTKYYLAKHAKENVNQIVARRLSIIINIIIIVPVLIIVMLYSAPPEYLDSSLKQTIENTQLLSDREPCNIVSTLLSYDSMRDGLGWWLMTKASLSITNTMTLLIGWTLFLLFHTFYIWAFSKLILSTTIAWNSIFFKFKKEMHSHSKWYKLDSFSIGFFGIIIILLTLTLTFSMPSADIAHSKSDNNNSKLVEILSIVDTMAYNEQNKNIKAIDRFIEVQANRTFKSVYANIPEYAQAQYTWYRDYISIYQVTKKEVSDSWERWKYFVNKHIWKEDVRYPTLNATKSYAQKSSEEIQRVLFGNGAFDKEIEVLNQNTNNYMQHLLSKSQGALLNSISNENQHITNISDTTQLLELNRAVEETFLVAKSELNKINRTYKMGQAGVTVILTKTIMTKLLAKSGVKVVAKGGSFLAGGATGLAVCAPSGPWAIACGAVAGTLTWVGVDFAVSKTDEILTREAFEMKLRHEIDRNKEALKSSMKESYLKGINQVFNNIDSEIKRPIDRVLKK